MITEGQLRLIAARYAGRGREFAYLELAQEHLLAWMQAHGLFENAGLVFKGGTAIRKFHLGLAGRFSTDLDFMAVDGAHVDYVLDSLRDGAVAFDGVRFEATSIDDVAGKARWRATASSLGSTIEAKVEFSRRPVLLAPVTPTARPELPGLRIDILGFDLPLVPLVRLEENVAEKLARFRRVIK